MDKTSDDAAWVIDRCLEADEMDPIGFLEELMGDSRCDDFGPIHHFLVGAVLLTCFHNSIGRHPGEEGDSLHADLEELLSRSSHVPGATCANWGVCGAAASVGRAYAILMGNEPLKQDGWSDGQRLVADTLSRIADAGAPRCCKRDSRIAIANAAEWFDTQLDAGFTSSDARPVCRTFERNSVCMGRDCPYHPAHTHAR